MPECIAVINAGSSSIKFAICEATGEANTLFRGQIEGLGVGPHLQVKDCRGCVIADRGWPAKDFDHDAATREILTTGVDLLGGMQVVGIGHRIVHGGIKYDAPIRLDSDVLAALSKLVALAPLHQPHNLAPVRALLEAAPQIPQVGCFDTAFHRTQDHLAQSFALPRSLADEGVRRYGFHGLSYEYLVSQLSRLDPNVATSRVIMAHLGNGASLCAVKNGRSVASTAQWGSLR
jgi:acetate kinase